jgi:four helix bundle protein
MTPPKRHFHHEKLVAYQRGIEFVAWSTELLEQRFPKLAVLDQLDRASTSIPLNIAEGNGKYTAPDRCRYLDTARGSALECAACLDVLVAKRRCTAEEIPKGKEILSEIVALLVGLIRSVAPDRLSKAVANRRVKDQAQERDQEREANSAHSK